MNSDDIPRIVIAGVASNVGKTTATVALTAALRQRGLCVRTFKCGPDYLDPTYLRSAAQSSCQNLDGWMMGRETVLRTFVAAARGCDIAVIEGMMGLYDGASPASEEGSTAQIAKWLKAPTLLVVDASGMARSIAAITQGFRDFDADLALCGAIANGVGGPGHVELLRQSLAPMPLVGALSTYPELRFPERHLGLVAYRQNGASDNCVSKWGAIAAENFAIDSILEIARSAPAIAAKEAPGRPNLSPRVRIGVAWDEAFHFYYEDNLERLREHGAELIRFSPLDDSLPPNVDGFYFGGGYPEVFADRLSQNLSMNSAIREFAERGGVIYAECGGLMYLSASITVGQSRYPMVGLIPIETVVHNRLQAIGYVEIETTTPTIFGPSGLGFRGHEFRYSEPIHRGKPIDNAYSIRGRYHHSAAEGYCRDNVLASYVHAHWASNPACAESFVASCALFAQKRDA